MISKTTTTKVLLDLLAEAVSNDSDSIRANIYLEDKGVKVTADITFKLEDIDDNHV